MNGPPASCCIDAVPSRTIRPSAATGREVPGRTPAIAASTDEVPGRAEPVPGRAKPESGRPLADIGRIPAPASPACSPA